VFAHSKGHTWPQYLCATEQLTRGNRSVSDFDDRLVSMLIMIQLVKLLFHVITANYNETKEDTCLCYSFKDDKQVAIGRYFTEWSKTTFHLVKLELTFHYFAAVTKL